MNTKNKFKDSLNQQLQNNEFLCEYINLTGRIEPEHRKAG